MEFQAEFRDVEIESVTKGKARYQIAHVTYAVRGETKTQKIMSFSNPETFKKVQELVSGDKITITVTKNDAGYSQWAKVEKVGSEKPPAVATPGKVLGSNYETREERARRQVYIIKQSSLERAMEYLKTKEEAFDTADVLATADIFVQYVLTEENLDSPDATDGLAQE